MSGPPSDCTLIEPQLEAALFGEAPSLFGHVAVVDHQVVGCSLWFLNFSTWRGVHGIYVEDLFVQTAYRGRGLGRALLVELARECRRATTPGWSGRCSTGTSRPSPSTGRWVRNPLDEWFTFRLTGSPLASLADG